MLQPKYSAAKPVLKGKIKPLAKAISNSNTSHLQTVPIPEHLSPKCRSMTIAGLERELNLPDSILSQDINPELASWLAAYPLQDEPLKNNFCVYDPEVDYSKVYAFATKNSQAAKRTDRVSKPMPPTWENPNPVKGWHGDRCPTIMELLNYAEKSANWDAERYEFWQDKNCMLSPQRQVDPSIAANEDTHEQIGLGTNDLVWYVGELVRYDSWLESRKTTERNSKNETVQLLPMPSGLEMLYANVPWTSEIPKEVLAIEHGEYTRFEAWLKDHEVLNPRREYVYRNPLKRYLHAVKRYHKHGEGSGESLVKLYTRLGIQPAFFVPLAPPKPIKKPIKKLGCNFILVGPPRDAFVAKVTRKIEALAPPKQKYIPSDEAIDELSENLSHGMYFSQSVARIIAEHTAKKTVQDMLPAIEFSLREMVKKELKAMFNPNDIPTTLHGRGFSTTNTGILTGQGFESVRRSDMLDEVNKAAGLKLC